MKKQVKYLQQGDVVVKFPYAGPERCPVIVRDVLNARQSGYRVVTGTDATGAFVQVPAGHSSNVVEVRE